MTPDEIQRICCYSQSSCAIKLLIIILFCKDEKGVEPDQLALLEM